MSYFWSLNKGLWEGEEEEEEEEEEGRNQTKVWILVWIHDFCMEFGMIFVYKLLGYGLLGFSLEINLVPFSRVLLGRHPNSRFKGSLVGNP